MARPPVPPTKDPVVTALQNLINQSPSGSDIVAPIRARAYHALHAMRGRSRRPARGPQLMEPGVERC
ncbi:MAG: hypothetical protein QOD58_270 [Mycobacterium sp.]|nr:hypothetical protein [Mycobacterium sp.]